MGNNSAGDTKAEARTTTARHAARPAGAAGASRPAGANRSAGTARTRSAAGGASANRAAASRAGARPAAKRGGASGARGPQKRRRGGARLNVRDKRFWLIVAAFAIVIALAVALALLLPGSAPKDEAVPANATLDGDAASQLSEETGGDSLPAQDAADGADAPAEAADEGAPAADAGDGAAESGDDEADAAQLSPEMVEMMQKYQVLSDVPNTAQPLGIQEGARAQDSYFDDALFVGDSVTLKLQEYVIYTRKHGEPNLLGGARFLAAQSFSARNALMKVSSKSIHPVIGGEKMTLEDAIAKLAPKKLFIMLGMNDVGISGIDGALENMGKLLARIREKNPDMQIFVESATPRLKGSHPTTKQLFVYDVRLYDAILKLNDPSIQFIDVGYAMRDDQGKLPREYCYDPEEMAIHFTNDGCKHWLDFLYTHVPA